MAFALYALSNLQMTSMEEGAWSHANTMPFYTTNLDIYELWYLRKALEPISCEY